jgi:hypothetical protein
VDLKISILPSNPSNPIELVVCEIARPQLKRSKLRNDRLKLAEGMKDMLNGLLRYLNGCSLEEISKLYVFGIQILGKTW